MKIIHSDEFLDYDCSKNDIKNLGNLSKHSPYKLNKYGNQ